MITGLILTEAGVVCDHGDTAAFPAATLAPNGDVLVAYATTGDCVAGGENRMVRSTDGGKTWSGPSSLVDTAYPGGAAQISLGMAATRSGVVLLPWYDVRPHSSTMFRPGDLHVWISSDSGKTWEKGVVRDAPAEAFSYGRIVELRNGVLLLPIWGAREDGERWRSGVLRSKDGGKTWGEHATIGYDPDAAPGREYGGFNETSIIEMKDGRLLAVLRACPWLTRAVFSRSISGDGGRTWSKPEAFGVVGTSPSLHRLPSGRLVLGMRGEVDEATGEPRFGVRLLLGNEDGSRWDGGSLWLDDPRGFVYESLSDAGYPAFVDLPDGTVLCFYYSRRNIGTGAVRLSDWGGWTFKGKKLPWFHSTYIALARLREESS